MSSLVKTIKTGFSFQEAGAKCQSLLAMDRLRHSVDHVGRCFARNIIHFSSVRKKDSEMDSIGLLPFIPRAEQKELSASDATIATAGMCSQMLFYGAFYSAICSTVGPIEGWHSAAVLLGPWWSSSYWMDWLLYDFARSAIPVEKITQPNLKKMIEFMNVWFAHNHHEEIQQASKAQKLCFLCCAVVLFATYALVCSNRPAASQVLLERSSPILQEIAHKASSAFQAMLMHPEVNSLLQDSFGF